MKKRIKIILIITILLLIFISGSYAYFNTMLDKPNNNATASVATKTLKVLYVDGAVINLDGLLPGQKVIKTFSVENIGNATTSYNLSFIDVINELSRKSDLVYSLTSTNGGYSLNEAATFTYHDYTFAQNVSIASGVKQEYTLTIEYKNLAEDQSVDMGSKIAVTINVTELDNLLGICSYEEGYEFLMPYNDDNPYDFVVQCSGVYKIELWGAAGGSQTNLNGGAYTSGIISLNKNEELFVYVGEQGNKGRYVTFNGGGAGGSSDRGDGWHGNSGGGATDVRLVGGNWDNQTSLASRIMVAAGSGGGTAQQYESGGNHSIAGWLVGGDGGYYDGHSYSDQNGKGATQLAGGAAGNNIYNSTGDVYPGTFGIGGSAYNDSSQVGAGGGGGGYYGGGAGGGTLSLGNGQGGGGGSSYISGYQGCVAITSENDLSPRKINNNTVTCDDTIALSNVACSIHYSGKTFTNPVMIDGGSQMPSTDGLSTITGNHGAGYAKITFIGF